MTIFRINNDDLSTRGLQELNKQPVSTHEIRKTSPSRPVEKSPEQQQYRPENRKEDEYSQRQPYDRRQHKQKVQLDTRFVEDRRSENKTENNKNQLKHHLDELV